jgi:hypothetical protein
MASRKNTHPIHSIHFRKDEMPHQIQVCTWHLGIIKSHLDKAESIISIPVTWSSEDMSCEACGRSHS